MDNYFFEGDLDDVINGLTTIKQECYDQGFKDVTITVDQYYDSSAFDIYGTRPETDEERDRRLTAARKEKAKKRTSKAEHKKFIEAEARKLGLL